tara:strand:- start:64 stop:183 length:120 start_codon:yes stop_codon:yes gene_type:complete
VVVDMLQEQYLAVMVPMDLVVEAVVQDTPTESQEEVVTV